jgi:hypothetical protein
MKPSSPHDFVQTQKKGELLARWEASFMHKPCMKLLLLGCRCRWVLDEFDTFFDVALEPLDSSFDQLLLLLIGAAKGIGGFLCTRWLDFC